MNKIKRYARFDYKINVERAFYYQGDKQVSMDIPYLNFEANGNVSIESQDENGPFLFCGYVNDDEIVLIKNYTNTNTHIYYYGRLEKNRLNLVYSYAQEWELLRSKLNSRDFMGCIIFKSNLYELSLNGFEYNLFLDKDADGEYKGLGVVEGKLYRVALAHKNGYDAKLRLRYRDQEIKKYPARVSGSRIVV